MEPYLSNPRFEAAVDALIAGDAPALQAMLRDDPKLIRTRSTRPHHATLLHYIGTNGVESERQKYPPNAVEMLKLLLAAGVPERVVMASWLSLAVCTMDVGSRPPFLCARV